MRGKRFLAVAGWVAVGVMSAALATQTMAQTNVNASQLPGSSLSLTDIFPTVLQNFLIVLGFAAFLGVVYGGFLYITSAGDAAKAEKGRKSLLWAIVGIVIATLSFLIVQIVIRDVGGLSLQ